MHCCVRFCHVVVHNGGVEADFLTCKNLCCLVHQRSLGLSSCCIICHHIGEPALVIEQPRYILLISLRIVHVAKRGYRTFLLVQHQIGHRLNHEIRLG